MTDHYSEEYRQLNVKTDIKKTQAPSRGIELYFEWKDLQRIKSNNAISSFRALIKEV